MDHCTHYQKLTGSSFLNTHFVFFDTEDYLADGLFIKHQVKVHFGHEYVHPDSPYRAILCYVRRRDEAKFLSAIEELPNKMLLCGHTDYLDVCQAMWQEIQEDSSEGRGSCDTVSTAEKT